MSFLQNKSTRALIVIMGALALVAITVAKLYYKNQNESVDPRIKSARALYEKYNHYAQQNQFDSIFLLMDKIEVIYNSIEHYKGSYETGVLYNNRAASNLILALHAERSLIDTVYQDSLFAIAELNTREAVLIYENWLQAYQEKTTDEMPDFIRDEFYMGLEVYSEKQKEKYLARRIKELEEAQTETQRRLSVSYTNQGIIYRHRKQYEEAAKSYQKALDLWDQNLTAENNLNLLLNRPLKKRNLIQKLFPPKRK